jgi:hypothetical protein
MGAQPLASFAISGAGRCDQSPVCRRVIEPLEVHQLMNHDVVPHPMWHRNEAPIEAHVSVAPAGSPPCPLIANTDTGHRQIVRVGQVPQPLRQFRLRLRPEFLSIVNGQAPARQELALSKDPFDMALRKGVRLSTRSAARNRHAKATVEFDTEQVSPRPPMTHEVDRRNRADSWRCERIGGNRRPRSHLAERKPQLHDDRIPDSNRGLDRPWYDSVIFITLVRGT